MSNPLPIIPASLSSLRLGVAARAKTRRLQFGWSRKTLAERAGVSYWTLKLFEETGNIAFGTLLKVAVALDSTADCIRLFSAEEKLPASLAELERMQPVRKQRGRTLK